MDKYTEEMERNHLEIQRKLIEARPHAIKVLTDIYNETENEHVKNDCAYTLVTRLTNSEIVELHNGGKINAIKMIAIAKEVEERKRERIYKAKTSAQKRRHQKREDFALTKDEWQGTLEYFDKACVYCGDDESITYDHFVAFSKGGPFTKGNIVPACSFCNSSKNNRDFDDWYSEQEFYSEERKEKILSFIDSFL